MRNPSFRSVIMICVLFSFIIVGGGWYMWSNLRHIETALRQSKFSTEMNVYPLVEEMFNLEDALRAFITNPSLANRELKKEDVSALHARLGDILAALIQWYWILVSLALRGGGLGFSAPPQRLAAAYWFAAPTFRQSASLVRSSPRRV